MVTTDRECAWQASSESDWLSLGQSRSGQGDGTVTWAAAANPIVNERRGAIVVNGTRVEVGQAAATCAFAIDRPRTSVDAVGGRHDVVVTAPAGCAWAARGDASWISIVSGVSGTGGGTVAVQVAANPSPQPRSGTLTIAGLIYTVDQAGMPPGGGGGPAPPGDSTCTFVVTPMAGSFGAEGGVLEVSVTPSAQTCTWTAQSAAPWIALEGGVAETGTGRRRFIVAANTTNQVRVGTVGVAGAGITITQAAASTPPSACTLTVAPTASAFPTEGGGGEVIVTASAGTCAWTAQTGAPWITLQGSSNETGSGVVRYSVAPNAEQAARAGTLTVAGHRVTVTQAAAAAPAPPTPPPPPAPPPAPPAPPCTFSLAPSSASVSADGGSAEIAITASASTCSWTARSSDAWLTIEGTGSGTGSGRATVAVAPNPGPAERRGTATVAGSSFSVTQAAPAPRPCTYSVSPTTTSLPVGGGSGEVSVTASAATCAWSATANDAWISLQSSGGTGTGRLAYSVTANVGPARTGRVTVAGQQVTITQPAGQSEEVTVSGAIAGLTGSCPNMTFTLSGTTIITTAATQYRSNEVCGNFRNGRQARVRGRLQPNGSVIAERIESISGGGDLLPD